MKTPARRELTVAELEELLSQPPSSRPGVFSRAVTASDGPRCGMPYCPEPHAMRPEPVNPPFVSLRLAEDGAKNWGWQALNWIWRVLWNLWVLLREMTGDTAYERYLTHMAQSHPGRALMSQQEYFKFRLDQKWNRISRCC